MIVLHACDSAVIRITKKIKCVNDYEMVSVAIVTPSEFLAITLSAKCKVRCKDGSI